MADKTIKIIEPSTIENIDFALFDFIKDEMDIRCTTKKGFEKIPVIWVAAERAYQIKNDKDLRDGSGMFKLPAITVERTGIIKDLTKKGGIWGDIGAMSRVRGNKIIISREINQEKTSNFANAHMKRRTNQVNFPRKNNKVVYNTVSIPVPIYIELTYKISVRTEYQQQLNEILTPFFNLTRAINYFAVSRNGHQYESFMQSDFSLDSNVAELGEEERRYKTDFEIKVLGHLIGNNKNEERPKITLKENAVEFKMGRERVVLEDTLDHIGVEGFYRD
mgnify:CR=1 FL=1